MSISETCPLLTVRDIVVRFPVTSGMLFQKETSVVHAVDGVSLSVERGRILGLVGESGSGKTTLGRAILRLVRVASGKVEFDGTSLTGLSEKQMKPFRKRIQVVFQDPYSTLNPRMTVFQTLVEPLTVHGIGSRLEREKAVTHMLDRVELSRRHLNRYPHEFSGGQRQRIAIGRALIGNPELVIMDEPVSALDVSIQAQILNLLAELRRELNLTLLFISHDLAVVRHIADDIAVMYLGRIIEEGPRDRVFDNPLHPYTKALLSSVLRHDKTRVRTILKGTIPSPGQLPPGCSFHTRCPEARPDCSELTQRLNVFQGRRVACQYAGERASLDQ